MVQIKSLAALLFLFLLVPGSGQLAWDGMPFSTRLELATLILFVVFFASNQLRSRLKDWLSSKAWVGALKPLLLILIVVKFGTFAYMPLSDGYESCYRSLYYPIDDPTLCERSYELPIRPKGALKTKSVSRVDQMIDFGVNPYDWSLPFVNDWRLQRLWLTRPPFKATFTTKLMNSSAEVRYIPILAIGEMAATSPDQTIKTNEYRNQFLELLPVSPGTSDLQLNYQYRDDELSIPPDTAPEPRGTYALLKVGKPLTTEEIFNFATIMIDISSISDINGQLPLSILITDSSGTDLAEVTDGEESANQDGSDTITKPRTNFKISFPATSLKYAPLTVSARFDNTRKVLGTISSSLQKPFDVKIFSTIDEATDYELRVWLDGQRESFDAYKPAARESVSAYLWLLLRVIDFFTAALVVGLIALLVLVLRSTLLLMLLLATASWIAINPLDSVLPRILGGGRELVVPYALISLLTLALHRKMSRYSFATFLPLAAVLAHNKVFDHLKYNHDDQGQHWWGKLLFLWRDSDWFATNGFARIIFDSGSLQGGDDVFWFQSGPRYWALATRLILGENDVLVGLIMTTLGFFSVIYLASRFLDAKPIRSSKVVMLFILFLGFIFQGDQLITAFGFVGSSEHPTWISLFVITGYLLGRGSETRTWLLVTISGLLAFLIHMRPNQILLLSALFLLVLSVADRSDIVGAARRYGWMTSTFVVIASLSLLHNIYFGRSIVPFTRNASINYAFEWSTLLQEGDRSNALRTVWTQFRTLMYWRTAPDQNFAIAFWGSQLFWIYVLVARVRSRTLIGRQSLTLLLPLTYILPMLKYQTSSYYPRHLVIASLACLCGALLAWPTHSSRNILGERVLGLPK